MNKSTIISALLLSLGITGSGFLIGYGIQQIRSNRFVSVKGLAERPVTADHGTWEISFVSSGKQSVFVRMIAMDDVILVSSPPTTF